MMSAVIVPTGVLPAASNRRLPLGDDRRECRIGRQRRLVDGVVGGGAEIAADIMGPLVEDEVQLRDDAAVGVGAGDDARLAGGIGEQAVVRQMRVTGDHRVDRGVECVVDGDDWSGDTDAGVDVTGRRRLRTTLVQQHDDGLDALRLQDWDERVGRLGLVEEIPTLDAGSGDQGVGGLKRHADEADLDVIEPLDPVGGQGRLAALVDDIGGEPLEVGAGVRLAREIAAIDGVTAAVLHTQQFGDTLVKFVVADAGDVELHRVERLDGRFVVEEPGKGR